MTTKNSPLAALQSQANYIANMLKRAERGEKIDTRFAEKIEAARKTPVFKVGIVMDDKVITIEIAWQIIKDTEESALSEYILKQMRESGDTVQ